MADLTSAVSAILDSLYVEAHVLFDEREAAFAEEASTRTPIRTEEDRGLARACEQTRTTMLMSDALRWLKERRPAHSAASIHHPHVRSLRLASCCTPAEESWLQLLPPFAAEFTRSVERFYARLVWLEGEMAAHKVPSLTLTAPSTDQVVRLDEWRSSRIKVSSPAA